MTRDSEQGLTESKRQRAMWGYLAAAVFLYAVAVAIYVVGQRTYLDGALLGIALGIGIGMAGQAFQLHMLRPNPEGRVLNAE